MGISGTVGRTFCEMGWKWFYTAFTLPVKLNGGFTLTKVHWALELGFSRQSHIHS
jgi:hypothetical protein